jgi:hypothetical protein
MKVSCTVYTLLRAPLSFIMHALYWKKWGRAVTDPNKRYSAKVNDSDVCLCQGCIYKFLNRLKITGKERRWQSYKTNYTWNLWMSKNRTGTCHVLDEVLVRLYVSFCFNQNGISSNDSFYRKWVFRKEKKDMHIFITSIIKST